MYYLLAYVSSAVSLFSEQELTDLLVKSRKNNQALDITGMLLYKEGNFMQLLEGPKDAVLSLKRKIEKDSRHSGMIVLLREEHEKREFPDWSMGFKSLNAETALEVPGYNNFFELSLIDEKFQKAPSAALKLLYSFRKVTR